ADAGGAPHEAWIAAPFAAFYAAFALVLVPAGRWCDRHGARGTVLLGLGLAGGGLGALAIGATTPNPLVLTLARFVCGLGQGLVFIGLQSQLLAQAGPQARSRAAGVIVSGFQGGMIAGVALGALIHDMLDAKGLFALAAALIAGAFVYALTSLRGSTPVTAPTRRRVLPDLFALAREPGFVGATLLVGLPAKAVLTGVVAFALPLLLATADYAKAEIGQVLVLYALCVLGASRCATRLADGAAGARSVLLGGVAISGAGLLVLGVGEGAGVLSLLVGAALVGVGHGLINAPVVAYVASTPAAGTIGAASTAASYRLLERIGHIAGPPLVGAALALTVEPWAGLGLIGLAVLILGVGFAVLTWLQGSPASDALRAGA
ncbi:MAG: MFS transporter, partial [Pseudomonadota bacterium]